MSRASSRITTCFDQSNVPNEVPHPAFEGLGYPCERYDRGLFLSSLNVANVISGEISLFRQSLLAQAGFFSLDPNGLSQGYVNFTRSRMHSLESKQNAKMELPTNGWYFVLFDACNFQAILLETLIVPKL